MATKVKEASTVSTIGAVSHQITIGRCEFWTADDWTGADIARSLADLPHRAVHYAMFDDEVRQYLRDALLLRVERGVLTVGDWKLSDRQLGMARSALSLLLPSERERFLLDFHSALPPRPSDADVSRVLHQILYGVAQNITEGEP